MAEQDKFKIVLDETKNVYHPEQHKDFIVEHFAGADQLIDLAAHNVADKIDDSVLNSKPFLDSAIAAELDQLRNNPQRWGITAEKLAKDENFRYLVSGLISNNSSVDYETDNHNDLDLDELKSLLSQLQIELPIVGGSLDDLILDYAKYALENWQNEDYLEDGMAGVNVKAQVRVDYNKLTSDLRVKLRERINESFDETSAEIIYKYLDQMESNDLIGVARRMANKFKLEEPAAVKRAVKEKFKETVEESWSDELFNYPGKTRIIKESNPNAVQKLTDNLFELYGGDELADSEIKDLVEQRINDAEFWNLTPEILINSNFFKNLAINYMSDNRFDEFPSEFEEALNSLGMEWSDYADESIDALLKANAQFAIEHWGEDFILKIDSEQHGFDFKRFERDFNDRAFKKLEEIIGQYSFPPEDEEGHMIDSVDLCNSVINWAQSWISGDFINDAMEEIVELINCQDPLDTMLVSDAYDRANEDYFEQHGED